jgi:SpoVK/Ycf46/Vps4 family AAA+-type ATPase
MEGVDSKQDRIMIVLTTNHPDDIPQALLRPGRLDAVVSIGAPDAGAVIKLLDLYGRGLISPAADLAQVARKLAGNIPATIRECVERAKLAAIPRLRPGQDVSLTAGDLGLAADSMLHHLALLAPRTLDLRSNLEKAASILAVPLAMQNLQNALGATESHDLPHPLPSPSPEVMARLSRAGNGHDHGNGR